jgi:hypothetical protein
VLSSSKVNCWDWFCFRSSRQRLPAVDSVDTELAAKKRSLSLEWSKVQPEIPLHKLNVWTPLDNFSDSAFAWFSPHLLKR